MVAPALNGRVGSDAEYHGVLSDTWVSGIKFGRETYQFLVAKPHAQVSYALKLINIDAETKTLLHSPSIDMLAVANGKAF